MNQKKVFSSGLTSAKAWMKLRHPTGTPHLKPFDRDAFLEPSSPVAAAETNKRWASQPIPRPLTNISTAQLNARVPPTPEEFRSWRQIAHRPITSTGITTAQIMDVVLTEKGLPLSRTFFVPTPILQVPLPRWPPGRQNYNPRQRASSPRRQPPMDLRNQDSKPAAFRPPTPPPSTRPSRQRTESSSPFEDRTLSVSPPPNGTPTKDTLSPPRKRRSARLDWTRAPQIP